MATTSSDWTTHNELSYLRGLVSGRWTLNPPIISREKLLTNYIRSIEDRKRWDTLGEIDADTVIREATKMLGDKTK